MNAKRIDSHKVLATTNNCWRHNCQSLLTESPLVNLISSGFEQQNRVASHNESMLFSVQSHEKGELSEFEIFASCGYHRVPESSPSEMEFDHSTYHLIDELIDYLNDPDDDDAVSSSSLFFSETCRHSCEADFDTLVTTHNSAAHEIVQRLHEATNKMQFMPYEPFLFPEADTLRAHLHRLSMIMGKSSISQEALHVWDREHGLPASHARTMLKTSRSRKLLQERTVHAPHKPTQNIDWTGK